MSSLLRSTKFVRYFTGAARTLILNSAKTAEVNLLANTKALVSASNVFLRDYATSKKAESLEPLLQKLDSEVRRYGRITKRDIDEVFDEIQAKNDITSSQSLLVIRCCGELVPEELPEQRTLLVQKIWSVLTERKIPMDISHYNALLRVYIENEHPFSPAKFLEELETKGLQPNRVTYQRLMWRYCLEGDVEGATRVLEKMRELNMPVSEPVLNALVMGHAFHGDTDGAKAVLETMAGAGLEPSNRTYTLLACGYARKGDIEGIENIIKTANNKDAYMTDKDILDIIEHLALGGHGDKAEQMFHHLLKGPGYNQDVCNVILKLINKGHEKTAKVIMNTMPKSTNIADTPFKGAFFVKQLLKIRKSSDEIIEICRELQNDGMVPSALYIATENALQLGLCELAEKLFVELKKDGVEIRQHYYWPLLTQKGKEGDEEGLLQILRNMMSSEVGVYGETLRDYVIPYLMKKDTPENVIVKLQIANVPVILGARNLMVELLDLGKIKEAANIALKYRPRGQFSLVARSLINAASRTKDIESFGNILHVISSTNPQASQVEEDSIEEPHNDESIISSEVGRIVKSTIKTLKSPKYCRKILEVVHSKGLRINTEAAEEIQQFLGQNMTSNLSQILSDLTSSDLEIAPLESPRQDITLPKSTAQLEKFLEQRKSKGENVNRLQKQLLLLYIKENNVEKVKKLLKEFEATEFDLSVANLAQLYEFFCQNDEIERAKDCHNKIIAKNPDFQLNNHKFVQMAFALIRANKYDEAVQYLTDNRPQKYDAENGSFMINSKSWQMLNFLAEQKDVYKVTEMTKLLIDNNYIVPSNVLLGPSIKVHLLKDDLEGALTEFENCCKQYRSTPWKGELMKTLIMKEDATKLQWLADLSTQIHGEVNILHDLVLAFIECGRLRQARRILETPGLQTRHRRLHDACQRYVEEGKSEYLEGLLEATKELSHIDRSNIFYQLLVTYCKADETEKALGLWTILQEEGEVPSDQFLIQLGEHLKSKNKDVPFIIPEDKEAIAQNHNTNIVEKIIPKPKQQGPTKNEISKNIETLVKEEKLDQATNYAIKMFENGVVPKSNVLKFLLKNLAEAGDVDKIQLFENYMTDKLKKEVTYNDKLTLAMFNRGHGGSHVDNLYKSVQSANTQADLEEALKQYPRSNALAKAVKDTELSTKCQKVAELAASKGQHMPANLLWMEYILADMEKEADSLWNKCLSNQNIVFRRLLQESHTRGEPKYAEKLLTMLESNDNLSKGALGNAYSRLINIYLTLNNVAKANETAKRAFKKGITSEHFNKNCINRLKSALEEAGQKMEFSAN